MVTVFSNTRRVPLVGTRNGLSYVITPKKMEKLRLKGASFGSKSPRLCTEVYPANKRLGTYTQLSYSKRMINGTKTEIGPCTYNLTSFTEELQKKPGSLRGICDTREKRFKDSQLFPRSITPGPGTYGNGGIPSAALEEKARMSVGRCPTIGRAKRFGCDTGDSGLGPGTYNLKSFTELMLSRKVGKDRPYYLSTRTRELFSPPKGVCPDPCKYPIVLPKFGEDLQKPEKRKHGVFGIMEQYPAIPTERIYLSTLSQCSRPVTSPGPGWYNVAAMTPKYRLGSGKQATFLSTAPRTSKRTEMMLNKNYNPIGPGRYNIPEVWLNKSKYSHRSSFLSGTKRYLHSPERDKFYQ